jgi:hypothetical protein
MKKNKESGQIKVHVINVGYDVKGTSVIAHLVWHPVYPKEYSMLDVESIWRYDTSKRHSVGTATLQPGDKFDLKKGQRIALAKAENAAYGEMVKEVRSTLHACDLGLAQATDFLLKAGRVKEGNKRYIERVDSGELD